MLWVCNYGGATEGYKQAGLNYLMALYSTGFRDINFSPLTGFRWDEQPAWAQPLTSGLQFGASQRPAIAHLLSTDVVVAPYSNNARAGLTTLETDRLPRWLGAKLNTNTSALIVPSPFNVEGLREAGYANPIHVLPHTIGPWWWETAPAPGADRPFTFTFVGTWTPRKNGIAVVRAYLAAFPEVTPHVALALKISGTLAELDRLRDEIGGRTDIWLWDVEWTERQIQWLHANTDCYVSAHHGEGWGMGPFQAKLLGKPVIYTDWSAVREFCSPGAGDIPIPYTLGPVPGYMHFMAQYAETDATTLQWADPSHDALVDAMREMAAHPAPYAAKAHAAAAELRQRYCWDTVGATFLKVLAELA